MYLASGGRTTFDTEKLENIFIEHQRKEILTAIRAIDPTIHELRLVGRNLVVDTEFGVTLPLEVVGDGIIKIVTTLIAAMNCRDGGLLCIDEIENGLHHSAMRPFWKVLLAFAQKHDVQVIATTHNLEMLQEAIGAVSEDDEDTFAFIRIAKRRDGEVVATSYTEDEYRMHIEEGIEIR